MVKKKIATKIVKSTYKNRGCRFDNPPASLGTIEDWNRMTRNEKKKKK